MSSGLVALGVADGAVWVEVSEDDRRRTVELARVELLVTEGRGTPETGQGVPDRPLLWQ